MLKHIQLIFFLFIHLVSVNGGNPVISPRATGIGGCSNLRDNIWSVLANPAATACHSNPVAGLMCLSDYLLPELATGCLAVCIPSPTGNFGLGSGTKGSRYYGEIFGTFCYSRKIGSSLYAGIAFNYSLIRQSGGSGSARLILPSAGIMLWPQRDLTLSLFIFNPINQEAAGYNEFNSNRRIITFGLSYKMGTDALFCSEITAREGPRNIYRAGLEFYPADVITIRAGISFEYYAEPTAGVGLKSGRTEIDIGLRRHPVMGFSPSLSMQFDFGKNENQ